MAKEVSVTPSQVRAAQKVVERNSARGRPTSEAIRKIADAGPEHEGPPADWTSPPAPWPPRWMRRDTVRVDVEEPTVAAGMTVTLVVDEAVRDQEDQDMSAENEAG